MREVPEDLTPAVDGRADARRPRLDERGHRVRLARLHDVDDAVLGVLERDEIAGPYREREMRDPEIVTFE